MADSKLRLGTGARFKNCVAKNKGKVSSPEALCASIGRKKFGAKRFAQLAAKGKK